jgi:HlyD family secretion protein
MQAGVDRSTTDLEHARLDYERAKELFSSKLLAKQDFDVKKAAYDEAVATLAESKSKMIQGKSQLAQAAAQNASTQKHIAQQKASLVGYSDALKKYSSFSPLEGIVTNLPMRVGETVVPGIQGSTASTIMTIADMSVITSEIKVDETDIVNIKVGQPAEITVDAIPNQTFHGHVTEIGNTALVRSTGVAASQSTTSSQEAKDFKVVIAIDNPPDEMRPGLSCTAKITTATAKNVLGVPIQALTTRTKADLEPKPKPGAPTVKLDAAAEKARKEDITGVFVVTKGKALFRKVETGITGATDTQVLSGLSEGDEIVTGSFQVIRTLRNDTSVKVDNKPIVPKTTT